MSNEENSVVSNDSPVQEVAQQVGNEPAPQAPSEPKFNPDDYVHKNRVNDILQQRTKEVAEKAAQKAREEAQTRQSQSTGMGGMQQMDEGKLRQLMQEEFDRREQNHRERYEQETYKKKVDDLANDFMGKIQAAKDTHPELLKRQDEITEIATLVPFINSTSEVAGITQHLLDNEGALGSILSLSQYASPAKVMQAIKKIEAAIKTNSDALNREYPNAPLSQPTPSINTMDSGASSIEALKKQPWLRG